MRWPSLRRVVIVTALLLTALLARVILIESTSYRPINDAGAYLTLASEIAHTGDYPTAQRPGLGAGGTLGPSAYYAPGFSYFLAAVDLLDGHATRRGPAIEPARLSQAVVGTAIVGMTGLLALELFGPGVAVIAMLLAALYPVLAELSTVLVSENLLTLLVLAAVWAVLRARRATRGFAWAAAAGIFIGLATLSHENGILVVIPLAVALWLPRPRSPQSGLARPKGARPEPRPERQAPGAFTRQRLAAPGVLIAATLITIAPWTIRNAVLLRRFIPVTDETGITLVGTYNGASAVNTQVPYKWQIYYGIPGEQRLTRGARRLTEPQLEDRLQRQALQYISDHPFSPFVVAYHNTLRLFELEGSFAWRASASAQGLSDDVAEVGVVSFWLLCLLAAAGAFTRTARRAPLWIWAVPLLLALSVVLINVETPRFRAPVDPFLVLLAACALHSALRRLLPARAGLGSTPVDGQGGTAEPARPGELVKVVKRGA